MNKLAYTRKSKLEKLDYLLLIQKSFYDLGCETADVDIPLLEELWCMEDIWLNDAIAYYGTRLRLLEFLMARRFKSMDVKEGKGTGASTSKTKAHSERKSGSFGTEFADHYDEEQGVSRSDEITKSKTKDAGISEGSHCQTDVHRMLQRDKGFGRSGNVTKGSRQGAHVTKSKTSSSYDGYQKGFSNRFGCNWTYSSEKGRGKAESTAKNYGAFAGGAESTATTSGSSSVSYWSRGVYDAAKSSETTHREGEGSRSLGGDNRTFSESTSEAGNFFNANNQSHNQKAHGGGTKDTSSHVKRSWTYGYGSGESYSKQDSWSDSGTKLNAYTTLRANSDSVGDSFDKFSFYSYKNNQLFSNLKSAYEIAKQNYDWILHHLHRDQGTTAVMTNLRDCAQKQRYQDLNFASLANLERSHCAILNCT